MVGKTSSLSKVRVRNLKDRGISAVQTPEAWVPAETGDRGGRGMLAGRADLQQKFSTQWEEREVRHECGWGSIMELWSPSYKFPIGNTSTSLACFSATVIERL